MWRSAARRAGAEIRVIEVVCTDEALHRTRLESRRRDIEGFYEPTWESVEARRREYEPWLDDRLVVNSSVPLNANLAEVIAYVESGHVKGGHGGPVDDARPLKLLMPATSHLP